MRAEVALGDDGGWTWPLEDGLALTANDKGWRPVRAMCAKQAPAGSAASVSAVEATVEPDAPIGPSNLHSHLMIRNDHWLAHWQIDVEVEVEIPAPLGTLLAQVVREKAA